MNNQIFMTLRKKSFLWIVYHLACLVAFIDVLFGMAIGKHGTPWLLNTTKIIFYLCGVVAVAAWIVNKINIVTDRYRQRHAKSDDL